MPMLLASMEATNRVPSCSTTENRPIEPAPSVTSVLPDSESEPPSSATPPMATCPVVVTRVPFATSTPPGFRAARPIGRRPWPSSLPDVVTEPPVSSTRPSRSAIAAIALPSPEVVMAVFDKVTVAPPPAAVTAVALTPCVFTVPRSTVTAAPVTLRTP